MRKILLFLIVFCINFAYAVELDCSSKSETLYICDSDTYMSIVRPTITLDYTDRGPLNIDTLKYWLKDNQSNEIALSYVFGQYGDDPAKPYLNFTPTADLLPSNYTLNSTVAKQGSEILGVSLVFFEIYFPPLTIELLDPATGVSGASPYNVTILTTSAGAPAYAECRYNEFEFIPYNSMTNEFTPNEGKTQHRVSVTGSKSLYIRCKDQYGNTDNKMLVQVTYASSAPSILALADPQKIIETISGELQTTVSVAVTSGPAVKCKYSASAPAGATDEAKYSSMTSFSNTNFASSHQQLLTTPTESFADKGSYTYHIMCLGQNNLYSNMAQAPILVDMSTPLSITRVNTPAYASTSNVWLNVSTNKHAACTFKNKTEEFSYATSNAKEHLYQLMNLPAKQHSFKVKCAKDAELTAETEIIFSIDTTKPSTPIVNDNSSLQGNPGYTYKTDELEASWSSADNESGIAEYQYSIEKAEGAVVLAWTSAGTATGVTVTSLDLVNGTYRFKVKARNGAGLWSDVGMSDGIIVDPSKKPAGDITPPIGTVTKNTFTDRIEVTLACSDSGSGCNTKFYGLSALTQQCSANKAYTVPLNVTSDSMFCWVLTDKAGNTARDNETILFSSSPKTCTAGSSCTQISLCPGTYDEKCVCIDVPDDDCPKISIICKDNDNDGYGVGCVKGNDCNDTNAQLYINCLTGCVIDTDGDGYGLGCDNGFDCDDNNAAVHENCTTGCIIDSDQDGYGLGCSKGLDCDDANPLSNDNCDSGCILDSDGDGYGLGCKKGSDCDDTSNKLYTTCPITGCTQDNDGDSYGLDCSKGSDCDDTNPLLNTDCSSTTSCTQDNDGDGYGSGCTNGPDCNDNNPSINTNCDSDGDGMPDDWELANNLDPYDPDDANLDNDNDGLTNKEEYDLKFTFGQSTDPNNADTDGDGYTDKEEADAKMSPVDKETHPKSPLLKIILIVIVSLAVLGGAGYFGYNWYISRSETALPGPTPLQTPARSAALPKQEKYKGEYDTMKKKRDIMKQQQRQRLFSAFEERQGGGANPEFYNRFRKEAPRAREEARGEARGETRAEDSIFKKLPGTDSDIFSKLSDIGKGKDYKAKKEKSDKKENIFDALTKLKK